MPSANWREKDQRRALRTPYFARYPLDAMLHKVEDNLYRLEVHDKYVQSND